MIVARRLLNYSQEAGLEKIYTDIFHSEGGEKLCGDQRSCGVGAE